MILSILLALVAVGTVYGFATGMGKQNIVGESRAVVFNAAFVALCVFAGLASSQINVAFMVAIMATGVLRMVCSLFWTTDIDKAMETIAAMKEAA